MRLRRITTGMFAIIVMFAAMQASLPGPQVEKPPEPPTEPVVYHGGLELPPPLESLMPHGARADRILMLKMLSGDEIIELSMELYLFGVVAAEVPVSFEIEALKAQAVAARTNAKHNISVMPKTRHPDADVCGDFTCCTAYSNDERLRERWGVDYVSNMSKIITAVTVTDGLYMTYDGLPILASFHSSSFGKTESSANVWLITLPYLQSVDSPETAEDVPGFVTSVTVSRSMFEETVSGVYPEAVLIGSGTSWITDAVYTDSGRLSELTIGGVNVRGTVLRSLFNLRSTAVEYEWFDDELLLTTTGFGHGIGMSQYGANVMAQNGSNFRDILHHYYTDISIHR